jgi:uracil-DNA glycosylase
LEGFPSYNEITVDRMKSALQRVAVINLKKLTGKEVADPSVVGAFALRDRHLLRRQIQEIQPHLIIGCGTFETLEWLLELDVDPNNPIEYAVRHTQTGAWVVPIRHQSRANSVHYEELKAKCLAIP